MFISSSTAENLYAEQQKVVRWGMGVGEKSKQHLMIMKCTDSSQQWVTALVLRFPRVNAELLIILISQATIAISF